MKEKGQVICIVEFQLINVEGEREIDVEWMMYHEDTRAISSYFWTQRLNHASLVRYSQAEKRVWTSLKGLSVRSNTEMAILKLSYVRCRLVSHYSNKIG